MAERGKEFLKKRAPFYLAGAAILIVLVVPGILEKSLEDVIPYPEGEDRIVLDYILEYTGPNDTGLSMMDALSSKIESEFSGAVYGHRATEVMVDVLATGTDTYRVTLDFQSQGGRLLYDWEVDMAGGQIRGNNDITKDAVDMVNFYD